MKEMSLLEIAVLAAALGSGLVAGAFFAFSTFVMGALGRLPAAQGIAAMQSINVVVINRWFLGLFLGTALLCIGVMAAAVMGGTPALPWLVAGGLCYLIGTLFVTIAFNIPRNDALARVAATSAEGETLWRNYLVTWTAWNTVRTVAALVAAAAFTVALWSGT